MTELQRKLNTIIAVRLAADIMEKSSAMIEWKNILEWSGCITGLSGALLLALNVQYSGWGWALFLLSNIAWIAYGWLTEARGMIVMQIGFLLTSVTGIWNCLLK